MSLSFDNLTSQGFPNQQTPLAFRWYSALNVGDTSQPGRMSPFLQDADGNLLVSLAGPGSVPLALPDDVDNVAPVATNSRVPTVARLYVFDDDASEYNRARAGDDDSEALDPLGPRIIAVENRGKRYVENDDAWRREHGNDTGTIAISAARAATTIFGNFLNTNWRGLHIIINVTVIGADTLTVSIEGFDAVTGLFYPLLTSLAISTTGTTVLKIGQGFTPIANATANDLIPYITQVNAVHSGPDPITYSIAANWGI